MDFGRGPQIVDVHTGEVLDTWVFTMVLAWSRHLYAELVTNQSVLIWLGCHRRAFQAFGGVPARLVIDNLKAAITRACYHDPQVQRAYAELAEAYGFCIAPCPVRQPEKKGIVEAGVKFVRRNFQGEYIPPQNITLAQFALRWQEARYPEWSPNTRHGYDTCLRRYILPALGGRRLDSLTSEDCQRLKARMLIKYAPATVELGLACLRLLMQSAVEWHYLRVSPMVGVKRPRKQRQEMRPLMPAQLQQLLESVKDPQWRALILLTVTGGLRLGEVAGARWQHLDLRSRTYFVRESLVQRAQVKELRQPKSAQSQAKVLLSPACCEALREHRRCQVERRLAVAGYEDQGFIFAKPDGRYWEARMLHSVWSKMLRDAGLPHFRFHDLRHTCAALLIDHGAHPKLVQQQLRHSSIRTTLDVYGHLFPQRVDEAVAGLDIALGLAPAPATPQRASK